MRKEAKSGDKDAASLVEKLQVIEEGLDQMKPASETGGPEIENILPLITSKPVMYVANMGDPSEENGEHVDLSVEDDGPGIPEDLWEHAFRPFFTTRSEDRHLGLGIPVAAHLADDWGGSLRLDHGKPGDGARLVLRLRVAKGSAIPRS